jgi:hypothetical protein
MISNLVYKSAYALEKLAAFAQGKGYGGNRSILQEIAIVRKMMKFSSPPLLMVDIGGNVGDYTYNLRKNFKQAEIHIFEPSAVNMHPFTST